LRCPFCLCSDVRVVDSRVVEEGNAIRRRRACEGCKKRFTTYERIEEALFLVVKRSGGREPFDRSKVVAGMRASLKNRPFSDSDLESAVSEIEDRLRLTGDECSTDQIGLLVLEWLKANDEVGYIRFASVYKGFEAWHDFEREAVSLVKKSEG
jgi:transcriptional repressor NrdR